MTECPGFRCDGRTVHDPPHRPSEKYYDYVDSDTGHAIRTDTYLGLDALGEQRVEKEMARCMTRLYRVPATEG